jgi:hypothetical protein
VLFVTMASASDYLFGFWGSVALGAVLTLGLSWLLWRRHPSRNPILGLVGFFAVLYPLSGLVPEHQDAVDGAVAVALVVYLFALDLGQRLRETGMPAPTRAATAG